MDEQKQSLCENKVLLDERLKSFNEVVQSEVRYSAYMKLLNRVQSKKFIELREKQTSKLVRMHGSQLLLKQNKESVINLSKNDIQPEMLDIFSLGINCHLKQKFDRTQRKVQLELLFEDVKELEKSKKVLVHNEEDLKCELERFGTKEIRDRTKDILTREQYKLIKEFNQDPSIITRKADKSNVYVILDKEYYENRINDVVSDEQKFTKIDKDPTNDLKQELNKLIVQCNSVQQDILFPKREGHYDPGYIYGNPKIHKSMINPPLRPIISQVGTVTYEISKRLNKLICKYIPKNYTVKSTYEFISLLKDVDKPSNIASLDVESLFTNVPVHRTVDIILENVYNHPTIPPPKIPSSILKQLLVICTTRTPFQNINGDLYIQHDGVSMGSCLGPTFADFYMCNLENNVFENHSDIKPPLYARYVDDIFLVLNDLKDLRPILCNFEANSVLKFTFETEKSEKLAFLDCLVQKFEDNFKTSVYVKDTNSGDCINYYSICPERYKVGVIKTLLHRAFHVSSDRYIFFHEVQRIKQLLTNNNFPIQVIEKTIENFLNDKLAYKNESGNLNAEQDLPNSKLYFESQMTTNYKAEEKKLQEIIQKHVTSTPETSSVKLIIYYKNRKLGNMLIRNRMYRAIPQEKRHHVVYQYTCNMAGCNAPKYIGYTTCALYDRFGMHTQNGSIKRHLVETHDAVRLKRRDLLASTTIIASCNIRRKLVMTEAVLIKDNKPQLNSQNEGCDRLLKIFKH